MVVVLAQDYRFARDLETGGDEPGTDAADLHEAIHNHVTMTIRFGVDQVHETYEELSAGRSGHASDARIEDQMWRSRSDSGVHPHG